MKCFKCLTEVPSGTEVCPQCGQTLIPKSNKNKNKKETKDPASTQIKQKEYQIGDTIKERYEVRAVLGRKGTGFTYKVRDKEKKKTFALKLIQSSLITSEEAKVRFLDIMQAVIKLNLNEIAAIYDYGEDDGALYFVSEYIEGLTLRKLLDVRKDMKQFFKGEELESILSQICKALITAHNNGIVHGDLKPENIFILPSGLKITELGITGSFSPLDFTSIQQDLGDAYKYIAPEIIIGGSLSKVSDIYSLGVIVYEMLTGMIPGGVVNPPTNYNSELPQAINDVILKALRQDHDQRTQYVSEFYKNLLESFGQKTMVFEEKPWTTKQAAEAEQTGTLQTEIDKDLLMYVETGSTTEPSATAQQKPVQEKETTDKAAPAPTVETKQEPQTPSKPTEPEQEKQTNKVEPTEEIKAPVQQPQQPPAQTIEKTTAAEQPISPEEPVKPKPPEEPIKEVIAEKKIEAEKQAPVNEAAPAEEQVQKSPQQQEATKDLIPNKPEKAGIEDIAKDLGIITEEIQTTGFKRSKPPEPVQPKPPFAQSQIEKPASSRPEPSHDVQAPPRSAPVAGTIKEEKKSPVPLIAGVIVVAIAGLIIAGWLLLKPVHYNTNLSGTTPSGTSNNGKNVTQPSPENHPVARTAAEVKPPVEKPAEPKKEAEKQVEKPRREKRIAALPKPPPPKCPADMVYIPAGSFIMGSNPSDPLRDFSEKADVRTYVKAFCIDKYEYPDQEGVIPQTKVSFYRAKKLCESEGKQLCSEDDWEKACKGPSNFKYPYGNVWNAGKCDTQNKDGTNKSIVPSGSYRSCVSGYGVYDMSGNVMEWTNNVFSPQDTTDRVVKGGSFTKPDWATRCAYRYNMLPNSTSNEVGFRCCKPPER